MSSIDVKERLRPFGISFEKSLDDLIKGIRANSNDQEKLSSFFEKCIKECKGELKSSDIDLKSIAILKLAYLEMYGFDMGWCSFSILEVMASTKFQHKRIGYLAAIQILQRQNNDDALMLMTNLLKKDLNSNQYIETSLAISGIAAIVSKELALDICDDLAKMLTHSKPLIRKKTVLAMYKLFLKNPEALKMYYHRIVDRLTDDDPTVVSATVNVICELATMNPSNYIELAPRLYEMLTTTNNNWMVIRLLRLFSSLTVTEPRLKSKLLPQIQNLMKSTKSLSLIYECVNTILNGNMLSADDKDTADLISHNLVDFFTSNDHNLKYVGLLSFVKVCKIHQNMLQKHSKLILTSIYDNDITIRETSLEIINALVTEQNIVAVVSRLTVQLLPPLEQQEALNKINDRMIEHVSKRNSYHHQILNGNDNGEDYQEDGDEDDYCSAFMPGSIQKPVTTPQKYRRLLFVKIIEICSMNHYANIPTFKWYLTVLNDLLKVNITNKISAIDKLITDQMVDIGIRVPSVRSLLVSICLNLCGFTENGPQDLMMFKHGLPNCMWLIGEYYDDYYQTEDSSTSDSDTEEFDTDNSAYKKIGPMEIIDELSEQNILHHLGYSNLDNIQTVYIQSISKILSKICTIYGFETWSLSQFQFIKTLTSKIIKWITKFENSPNFEVQERALSFTEVLKLLTVSLDDEIQYMLLENKDFHQPPAFLMKGYNHLFSSFEIKPVNLHAQQNIPTPDDLSLTDIIDEEATTNLHSLIYRLELESIEIIGNNPENIVDDDNDDYSAIESANTEENAILLTENSLMKENDPYYIKSDLNNGKPREELSGNVKQKKPSKAKKQKKEKIILDVDEEQEKLLITEDIPSNHLKKSKFYDASKLADVDLRDSSAEPQVAFEEYQTTKSPDQLNEIHQSYEGIKVEVPLLKSTHKKKPKKKIRKKVAVIE